MGTDIISEAILGVKVKRSDIFYPKKVKIYAHNYPDDFEFDPKTGKELWYMASLSKLEGCPYYISTPEYRAKLDRGHPNDEFVICMMCAKTESSRSGSDIGNINFSDTSFIELYNKFKTYIISNNLPFNFGLYAITTYY